MSSSPYISEDLKNYLVKFKIEPLINACVNGIAREMPADPYSYIIKNFEKHASQDIEIAGIDATEILSSEGVPVLTLSVTAKYLSKEIKFRLPNPFPIAGDANMIFDEDRLNGKGQNKGIAFLKKLEAGLAKKNCSQQADIDAHLSKEYQQNEKKGLYQINICSYLPALIQAQVLGQPLHRVFAQISGREPEDKPPINVMINCLQGSKLVGSKCKPFKFILIGEKVTDPYQVSTVIQAIRKTIVSGKGGQAALKFHTDGTFICPADTINDNLKIVEDAIVSTNNKDRFTIGISWMADNFYVPEQKKYELENPKALLDTDQLVEFLFKLASDKPLISYYEDPVFGDDQVAWGKILTKFKDTKVRIGSRKLFANVEGIKKHGLPVTKQTNPELDEAAITDLNSKRIALHMHYYKPFELQTLSKLLAIKKSLKPIKTIMLFGDNNYQTHDTSLVDLSVGLGAYIVLAPPVKFDRISKLNRMKQILQ